ncbi:MAG: type III restriction endonuclease subunit R, partial [Chloroflexota bacterium]
RDSLKWLRPAKGQCQMFYKRGTEQPEYVPDFVAETADYLYLLESKARNEMTDAEVLAKQEVAVRWCSHATKHTLENGGKPWRYALIPHDAIAENMTLKGLVSQFVVAG